MLNRERERVRKWPIILKSCRLGYYFKNAKRYEKYMFSAELQAVECVG